MKVVVCSDRSPCLCVSPNKVEADCVLPENSCGWDCVREDSKKLESPRSEFPSCEPRGLAVDSSGKRPEELMMFGL